MDQNAEKHINNAARMILAHQGSETVVRAVLNTLYRIGFVDGQIERAEAALAKLKEAA